MNNDKRSAVQFNQKNTAAFNEYLKTYEQNQQKAEDEENVNTARTLNFGNMDEMEEEDEDAMIALNLEEVNRQLDVLEITDLEPAEIINEAGIHNKL